jgi:hypothetical protein
LGTFYRPNWPDIDCAMHLLGFNSKFGSEVDDIAMHETMSF